MLEKREIRNGMKKKLAGIPRTEYEAMCVNIASRLTRLDEWKQSKIIGITLSTENEIDTRPIIETAWQEKKHVAIPRIHSETKTLTFRLIDSFHQVETSFIGILEPIERETEYVEKNKIDLLIVPGLVLDQNGYRIGFGGGYYDRYLSSFSGWKVSLAFELQIIEKIPADVFDIPVQKIVTPKRVLVTEHST